MESQRKEETMMEKLNALLVLFRGDVAAVAEFVCGAVSRYWPRFSIGHDLRSLIRRSAGLPMGSAREVTVVSTATLMFGESYLPHRQEGWD